MDDDIDAYYAELDRRMGISPSHYQVHFPSNASDEQHNSTISSTISDFNARPGASSTQPGVPYFNFETASTPDPDASSTGECSFQIGRHMNQASQSEQVDVVQEANMIQSRKRPSTAEYISSKKRRIEHLYPSAVKTASIKGDTASKRTSQEGNIGSRSSSSMEDISMYPDEDEIRPLPKPKSNRLETDTTHMARPIKRQSAAKLIPAHEPRGFEGAHPSDGLEDISMSTIEGSPAKVIDNLSKAGAQAQGENDPVSTRESVKTSKSISKAKGFAKRPAFTTVKEYILSTRGIPSGPNNFLKGKCIFYIGKDGNYISQGTKNKIDLIIKHGGIVQDTFDPATTTIIITDTDKISTARALGLRKITDIPMHIPTVKWSWMQAPMGSRSVQRRATTFGKDATFDDLLEEPWKHCAFEVRSRAGDQAFWEMRERKKATAAARALSLKSRPANSVLRPTSNEESEGDAQPVASTSTLPPQATTALPLSPPASPPPTKSREPVNINPLEEFYGQAREDVEGGYETDDSSQGKLLPTYRPPKIGWQCDGRAPEIGANPNQDVIDKLEELRKLHSNKVGEENRWRAYTYQKLIPILRAFPRRITCKEDIQSIKGIGERTVQKVMEIVNTGNLRRIEYERTEEVKCMIIFQGIYGVGQSTALGWYQAGCRTLDDIRVCKGGITLNSVQTIGLQYYDDINERIPRAEVQSIFDLIKPLALKIDPKLSIDIMGSFRRGKDTCGDIDILITRPTEDGRTHSGIMGRLLKTLHSSGILTEDLSLPDDMDDLECSYRGLCRLPDVPGSLRRRIDILCIPWVSRGAALLYYTGDDIFNRSMRLEANKMGYSLNQRGLFSGIVRDPTDRTKKLNEGSIIASETEEQIFNILGVPWQEPHERVRS